MALDPRTPVLVGVGAVVRHDDDPTVAPDATGLMVAAAEQALADSGAPALGARVGEVLIPRGTWSSRNPAAAVAGAVGAPDARTVLANVGVPQLTLLNRVFDAIADGRLEAALVCGGEAKHRSSLAGRLGIDAPESGEHDAEPDETLVPGVDLLTKAEIERQLTVAARQYAVIETALRHHLGHTPAEHVEHLGRLWSAFAAVAARNPDAWDRRSPGAGEIAHPGSGNRMIAAPYTKLLCSQWNVDQAAALLVVSAGAAEAAGVPRDRWVFPLASAESSFVLPLPLRAEMHRWPSFGVVARRVFETAGEPDHVNLYSCFPAAVQVQAAEIGLPLDPAPTVTGGMTFGGGPLNNYTYQSIVTMARRLRDDAGSVGLTTAVSGLLTKPAATAWSTEPPVRPCRGEDVSASAEEATETKVLDADATGEGTIAGYTVLHDGGAPVTGIAVVDVAGVRTVAVCDDASVAAAMVSEEWVGKAIRVREPGRFDGGV